MTSTAQSSSGSADPLLTSARDQFRAGRYQDAAATIETLFERQPANPVLFNLAAATARALGRRAQAEALWTQAVSLKPDYSEAHSNFGTFLLEDKRYAEAEVHLRAVLQANPNQVSTLNNLGVALEGQNRVPEALACYDSAIAVVPDDARLHHNRGLQLVALGRFEEGQAALERALRLARDKAPYYRSLSISKRFSREDPLISEMEDLAGRIGSLSPRDTMELHFALGKAYADTDQHERSLTHVLAGNAERRRQIVYREPETLAQFELMRASFTRDLIAKHAGSGDPSSMPIFVLGMPRSGSSLVEQILASHPDVYGAGELQDLRVLAESFLSFDPGLTLPAYLESLPGEAFRRLGGRYVESLRAHAPGSRLIIDKRPLNFLFIGLIHLALPNAKIIHTQRDAVDTCISCFSQLFAGDYPFTYQLRELGRYWRAYAELMGHWENVLPPGTILQVRYDDLVADPEGQTHRMLNHCGLRWSDSCRDFQRPPRAVRTASAMQVRQPIYQKPPHPWRGNDQFMLPLMEGLSGNPGGL